MDLEEEEIVKEKVSHHGKVKRRAEKTRLQRREVVNNPSIPSLRFTAEQMGETAPNLNAEETKEQTNSTEEENLSDRFASAPYPVLAQLESHDPADREFACRALSNIVQDPDGLQVFLEHQGLKKLIQHYCDFETEVKIAAAGCLRNITVVADHLCDEIVKSDCITPIVAIIQQSVSTLNSNPEQEQLKQICSLLLQTIALLSNLCVYAENATKIFARSNSTQLLMNLLNKNIIPEELMVETAQLLNTITDENSACVQQLRTVQVIKLLESLIIDTSINIYIRILAASIGFNLSDESTRMRAVKTLAPSLIAVLQLNLVEGLERTNVTSLLSTDNSTENVDIIISQDTENRFKQWTYAAESVKLGLEILTNICTQEESDDMEDENEEFQITLSNELKSLILNSGLFKMVSNKCLYSVPADLIQKISKQIHDFPVHLFVDTQCRALNCLANMLLAFTPQELNQPLETSWSFLCQICTDSKLYSVDLTEAVIHCMFFFLKKYQKQLPFQLTNEHAQVVAQYSRADNEEVRYYVSALLGIFGQQTNLTGLLQDIAKVFIVNLQDPSLTVICETLNSIFDIFAEPPVNEIIKSLDVLSHLQKCLARLRDVDPSSKDGEVEAAEVNLKEFLKYKYEQFR